MKSLIGSGLFSLGMLFGGVTYANEISPDFLKSELEIAHSEYLNGSRESGLYALEALARILESDRSANLQSEVGPNNLAYTYLRIGMLHEKSGNQLKTDAYFNKALSSYQGKKVEIGQLKDFILQLDERAAIRYQSSKSQ